MMTAEQLDALSDIVSGAREEFSHACSATTPNAEACAEQIENLAFAAEMAEMDGLNQLCRTLGDTLTDLNDRKQLQALVQWTDQVLDFIRNPDNESLAKQLVALLPEEKHDNLLSLLLRSPEPEQPAPAPRQAQVINLRPEQELIILDQEKQDFSDSTADQNEPNELQALLISELRQMASELGKVLDEMIAASFDDALDALKDRYCNAIQRLADTAQLTELTGLEHLCNHIIANTRLLNRTWLNSHRSHAYLVFRQWPVLVLDYLSEPGNDEHCLSLISHLELEGWPQPIEETDARQLLEQLIATGTVQDQSEAEEPRTADPADMDLALAPDLNHDLLDAFLHDAPTQAAELSACVNALTGGDQDQAVIAQAQRITHTLKGAANICAIKGVANMAHVLEDIFEQLRQPPYQLEASLHATLQASADCTEAMVDSLQGKDDAPAERFMLYQELIDYLNNRQQVQIATPSVDTLDKKLATATDTDEPEWNPDANENNNAVDAGTVETVRVPLQVISSLFQLAEEITIALGSTQEQAHRIQKQLNEIQLQDHRIQEQRFELENAVDVRAAANRQRNLQKQRNDGEFDSLEMDQYDEIYDVAHALIEAVADSRELNREAGDQIRELDALMLQQSRLNKELQRLVKHTRMVPAQTLVPRLQRCIRHAARITGKMVQFEVAGAQTEINEDVLNKLVDPLMHLLRNAVDHGIEFAQERTQAGKSSEGHINLFFDQDGQHILIRCDDDGAGVNGEKVRIKAVERGLIGPADQLSQAQIHQLLLSPGFSTKDSINQVSGRGIGMDAVYKRIRELGGMLHIEQRPSGGTRFEIKVPLQLVASHALLVELQQQWFAIPTRQLNQILPPGGGEITHVGEAPALAYENQIYPAHHLGQMLGLAARPQTPGEWQHLPMLLTQNAQEAAALCVDAVIANQDLVIKPTGDYVKNVPGVSGVAILGDGRLVPVLDIASLLDRRHPLMSRVLQSDSMEDDYHQQDRSVLIVDDSLSVRKSLTQLVGDAGYRTDTARDGLDAWDKISLHPPAVILVDMEMPRMNGIELTSRIRNNEHTKDIPVLMITSRSMQKHRTAAEKAGVTEYFTKPFSEADLLGRIHQYLERQEQPA